MRSYLRCFTYSRGLKYMTLLCKNHFDLPFYCKTFYSLCNIKILASKTSCHTLYAIRKSNMYDSHYTILYYTHLYAPIRIYRIVSSYVTRNKEIIMFVFKYSRALKTYTVYPNSLLLCDRSLIPGHKRLCSHTDIRYTVFAIRYSLFCIRYTYIRPWRFT